MSSSGSSAAIVEERMSDRHDRGYPRQAPAPKGRLPLDATARKALPLATGCLDYFPNAFLDVAELSRIGNDQHNPGQPLHWSRGKSNDHPDCLMRHFVDRGKIDTDGVRHSTKVVWRALAILQLEIEAANASGK